MAEERDVMNSRQGQEERGRSRFDSLGARLAVAGVGIPLMAGAAWLGGWWLFALTLLLCLLAFVEYLRISGGSIRQPEWQWGLVGVSLILLYFQMPGLSLAFLAIWLLIFLNLLLSAIDRSKLISCAMVLLGLAYIPTLLGQMLLIRGWEFGSGLGELLSGREHGRQGFWVLLWAMALVWINDTGAYFAGLLWGRHRLAPSISPNKSIEGLLGGAGATVILAVVLARCWRLPWGLGHSLALALLIVVCGTLGDLVESRLKRLAGVKDSGNLLPGHGGVLDRFDSLLFVLPVVYWYIKSMFTP